MRIVRSPLLVLGTVSIIAGAIACSGSGLKESVDDTSSSATVARAGGGTTGGGKGGSRDGGASGGGGTIIEAGPPATGSGTVIDGVSRATLEACLGDNQPLAPNATRSLTCVMSAPLGGARSLFVPEMFVTGGNGCVVTTDKPHVVMVDNDEAVTATFVNRCPYVVLMEQGGLAWMRYDLIGPPSNDGGTTNPPPSVTLFDNVSNSSYQSCKGPNTTLDTNESGTFSCRVSVPLPLDILVTPQTSFSGNGCIVADGPPRVVMNDSDIYVSAQVHNICTSPQPMSEGGVAWMVFTGGKKSSHPLAVANLASAAAGTCSGPAAPLAPGGAAGFTCNVNAPLDKTHLLVTPEMYVPGNACIVAGSLPTTLPLGDGLGVTTTLSNRCGSSQSQSEGGLGWISWQGLAPDLDGGL